MLKLMSMAAVLLLAAVLFAQDAATPPAGPTVTPFGMAQYRLRLRLMSTKPTTGDATSAMNYRNQIAYFIGTNVKVNEVVSLGFQIGDDATSTEEASFLQQKTTPTWISQAWAKMDAGVVNLTFGVLPVTGNATLDLIERSLNNTGALAGTYAKAAEVSWPVGTNASLEAVKIGVPLLKDNFKLGIDLTQAVITNRTQAEAKDPVSNPPSVMFLLNIPMSIAALTVTPDVAFTLNRDVNVYTEKSDPEIGAGISVGYKLSDKISFSAKGAIAMHSNDNCYKTAKDTVIATVRDTVDITNFQYTGILGGVGTVIGVGPGKLMLDVNGSTFEDKKNSATKGTYIFADLKYGFCMVEKARKNITVMPRVRLFLDQLETMDKQEIRPELIFIGKF
jgi:hypothetical protein